MYSSDHSAIFIDGLYITTGRLGPLHCNLNSYLEFSNVGPIPKNDKHEELWVECGSRIQIIIKDKEIACTKYALIFFVLFWQ